MPEQFTQLVTAFLAGFDPAILDGAKSKSYAAWLDKRAHDASSGFAV